MQKGKKKPVVKKQLKRMKFPLDRAITKILPKIYERMNYTPQELWLKFTEYVERSDKHGEEICISGFQVYASVGSNYLSQTKESQEFSGIIDSIMQHFEYRYEQKASKGVSMAYIMNNRFKGKRESVQKNENTENLHKDVKDILNQIIYKKPAEPDGSK